MVSEYINDGGNVMWYNPKTGNFALSQPNITEYKMDEITLEMVEVIIGADEDYILVPDKPSEGASSNE